MTPTPAQLRRQLEADALRLAREGYNHAAIYTMLPLHLEPDERRRIAAAAVEIARRER